MIGGERGIRTPGPVTVNGFQDRRNRPLCHLSGANVRQASFQSKSYRCINFDQIFFMKELAALLPYGWKHRYRLAGGLLFVIVSNYFNVLSPQVTGFVIDYVQRSQQLPGYRQSSMSPSYDGLVLLITRHIENWAPGLAAVVALCGVTILTFALLRGFFLFLMRQTIIVMSRHIEYEQKNEIFNHYQQMDAGFFRLQRTGDLMNRITEDVSRVRMFTGPAVMYVANLVAVISLSVFFMLKRDVELTLYVLAPLPILAVAIYYINTIIHHRSERIQEILSDLTTQAQETYTGIRVIKAFVQEKAMLGFFRKLSVNYRKEVLGLVKVEALYFPSISLLIGISTLLTIMIGGMYYIQGTSGIGINTIVEFVMYINMLTFPVSAIGLTASMIQRAAASQKRINEFMACKPAIVDWPHAKPFKLEGNIVFEKVSFTYADSGVKALKEVSLQIQKGERVAIVGRTGSGKSTLVQLLLRLYEPDAGVIKLDGTQLSAITLRSLRSQIGYVPQDVFLFSDTVIKNIAFGLTDVSEDSVIAAAKGAAIHNEIMSFSKQYQTIIGERGVTLSGGQKQRISIARALLRKPTILVFDDCLSAVDVQTEQQIAEYLDRQLAERTSILVTHRVYAHLRIDKVIVLEEGRIVESGTPAALLSRGGFYADLYRRQQVISAETQAGK